MMDSGLTTDAGVVVHFGFVLFVMGKIQRSEIEVFWDGRKRMSIDLDNDTPRHQSKQHERATNNTHNDDKNDDKDNKDGCACVGVGIGAAIVVDNDVCVHRQRKEGRNYREWSTTAVWEEGSSDSVVSGQERTETRAVSSIH